MLNDTICAVSTALHEGAISIVRMSGSESFDILKKVSDIRTCKANTIVYGHIKEEGEVIDEVLVSFFVSPKSYTREDMVEINCHGGIAVTRRILNLLLKEGCRMAERGEFTKRAYLNGRIDLSQADSVNDLIYAKTSLQSKSAIRGLSGSVERLLYPLMEEMKDVISMIEVNIDYPEYEDERQMTQEVIYPYLTKWIDECTKMIDKAERFRVVKDGVKTVIIGKPNVGKSSLLNALLEKDKAIVTDIAGTTRDLVEGRAVLDNVTLELIDTAGIRESEDVIERIGIDKSLEAMEEADLILLLLDSSDIDEEDEKLLKATEGRKRLVVYNKDDIHQVGDLHISAKNKDISALVKRINDLYQDDIDLVDEDILNNERQIALMKRCLSELKDMEKKIGEINIDVLLIDLEEAYRDLSEILGKEYREDLIDHMFRNFCLGK
ncbi:MAG: tRNA uridine-5-carboxymethylaminomethyl(34) synthesis GTPase MnmE [Erysipelotrichaceae bacterium]|nr:tRNA uridine-5-carboxymethylaminomethyl(34) synthesis GTPase MnmE [Erysipelotrichaceae bacterium]